MVKLFVSPLYSRTMPERKKATEQEMARNLFFHSPAKKVAAHRKVFSLVRAQPLQTLNHRNFSLIVKHVLSSAHKTREGLRGIVMAYFSRNIYPPFKVQLRDDNQ
jgi:hypothetical protein